MPLVGGTPRGATGSQKPHAPALISDAWFTLGLICVGVREIDRTTRDCPVRHILTYFLDCDSRMASGGMSLRLPEHHVPEPDQHRRGKAVPPDGRYPLMMHTK
jgi:hypothetical protein